MESQWPHNGDLPSISVTISILFCHDARIDPVYAERALRPLVIFRKVCLRTRSDQGSENIAIFSSLTRMALF